MLRPARRPTTNVTTAEINPSAPTSAATGKSPMRSMLHRGWARVQCPTHLGTCHDQERIPNRLSLTSSAHDAPCEVNVRKCLGRRNLHAITLPPFRTARQAYLFKALTGPRRAWSAAAAGEYQMPASAGPLSTTPWPPV